MIGLLKDIFIGLLYLVGIMMAASAVLLLAVVIVKVWQERK